MRTVLQFQAAFSTVCRRIADGVRDFAASAGWRLHVVPYANAAEIEDDGFGNVCDADGIAKLLDEWRPDGCLVQWSSLWPDLAQSIPGIPCVTTDNPYAANAVCFDNAAIGRAAADELLPSRPSSPIPSGPTRATPTTRNTTSASATATTRQSPHSMR